MVRGLPGDKDCSLATMPAWTWVAYVFGFVCFLSFFVSVTYKANNIKLYAFGMSVISVVGIKYFLETPTKITLVIVCMLF